MRKHNRVSTATVVALGLMAGSMQPALAADTVMSFGDNLSPLPLFPSSINSSPFAPGTEMRILDPAGFPAGGPPGPHKDIFNGTEQWVFDMTTNEMKDVVNTAATPGATALPGSTCPPGCDGISQNALFFFVPLGFLAPTTGSLAGAAYGPAELNITGPSAFNVHFPVLEVQWAGVYFPLGSAGSQGVTFQCTGDPGNAFHCVMEHTIQASEDPAFAGFAGFTLQMEVGAPVAVTAVIDVPGGTTQECASPAGTEVTLNAVTATPGGGTVTSIDWDVDGSFFGSGPSISPVLNLGPHTVDLMVTTDGGNMATDSRMITIQDTTDPDLMAAFKDSQTGNVVTSVSGPGTSFVEVSLELTDACDPTPQVTSATLTPTHMTADGEVLKIKHNSGDVGLPVTALSLDATAEDASGNTTAASAELEILD